MFSFSLHYGPLTIHVISSEKPYFPLPIERKTFPMWIPKTKIEIVLLPNYNITICNSRLDLPKELQVFYSVLGDLNLTHVPPELHCNKWWVENEIVYGVFPYITDRFRLLVYPNKNRIIIMGNLINLNRIVIDILSCFAIIPPLHGAAIKKNNKGYILLADSGVGKTRALSYLTKRGFSYVADEEIFWQHNQILSCGCIAVKKGTDFDAYYPSPQEGELTYPVSQVFILSRDGMRNAPVLFPFIAKQGFWAQCLIKQDAIDCYYDIRSRLENALRMYSGILKRAIHIDVNDIHFEQSMQEITDYINCHCC